MLVTFKTATYAEITMFGDAAESLLKWMGQSGNVPGALLADDVRPALEALESALAVHSPPAQPSEDMAANQHAEEPDEAPVSMATRALPLLELLRSAAAAGDSVMWES